MSALGRNGQVQGGFLPYFLLVRPLCVRLPDKGLLRLLHFSTCLASSWRSFTLYAPNFTPPGWVSFDWFHSHLCRHSDTGEHALLSTSVWLAADTVRRIKCVCAVLMLAALCIQKKVLDRRASHAVPLRGEDDHRVGFGQLLFKHTPRADIFCWPERQWITAQINDRHLVGVQLMLVDQRLAHKARDFGGLAVTAAAAGDDGDVEHGVFSQ